MQDNEVLGCKLSKSLSFSQDEELYIATSDTKIKMEEDYAPFVDKVLNDISFIPSKVLDLGCGPGYIARRISDVLPNTSVFGIDKSPVMINHAKTVFKNMLIKLNNNCVAGYSEGLVKTAMSKETFSMLGRGFNISSCSTVVYKGSYPLTLSRELNYDNIGNRDSRLKYIIADSERLPFASGIFDLIILKGTFKCLEDKTNSLKEMCRVLSPEGEIFIYEFRKDIPEDEFNELTKNMKPQKANSLRRKLNCSLDMFEYEEHLCKAGLDGCYEINSDGLDLKIRINKKT